MVLEVVRFLRVKGGRRGRHLYAALHPLIAVTVFAASQLPLPVARWALGAMRHRRGLAARAARFALVKRVAGHCGELVDVRESVYLYGLSGVRLGSRVSVHPMTYLDGTGGVDIGSDVSIAHGVTIMSTTHNYEDSGRPVRDQGLTARPVSIRDDVWIGAGARVLPGVTVGHGAVIGAGSVVTRDVDPYTVVAGVPARVVRMRSSDGATP